MMKSSSDGFVQAYNAQIVVEPELQLIVGQAVTQAANDKEQVAPMMAVVEAQSGQRPEAVIADSGYCSEKNLEGLESEQQPAATHRSFHGHGATEAGGAAGVWARAVTKRRDAGGTDEAEVADQGGGGDLCHAQRDRGTGVRADQGGAGIPAIFVARVREGESGMGVGVRDAQYFENVSSLLRVGGRRKVSADHERATKRAATRGQSGRAE